MRSSTDSIFGSGIGDGDSGLDAVAEFYHRAGHSRFLIKLFNFGLQMS